MQGRLLLVGEDPASGRHRLAELETGGWQVEGPLPAVDALRWLDHHATDAAFVSAALGGLTPGEFGVLVRRRTRRRQVALFLVGPGETEPGCPGDYDGALTSLEPATVIPPVAAALRRQCESPDFWRTAPYHGRTLRVDFAACDVRVDGVPEILTKRELQLLCDLVTRRGQVVTREELVERVWENRVSLASNTIEHHIARLRHKLARAGRVIHTVVGVGYRFSEDGPGGDVGP